MGLLRPPAPRHRDRGVRPTTPMTPAAARSRDVCVVALWAVLWQRCGGTVNSTAGCDVFFTLAPKPPVHKRARMGPARAG